MNILAIGNSFSQDSTRYLHQIARKQNENLTVVNLYIGGCSLSLHHRNMLSEEKKYMLQFNGYSTGFYVSIKDALLASEWDYVTFQQASYASFDYETFMPYLKELSDYVKKFAPKAKQVIHQTWAYEQGSAKLAGVGFDTPIDMYKGIESAYTKAANDIGASLIIPSGKLFQNILSAGIEKVHRDTFHAKLGLGRYALGLLWYTVLTGNPVENDEYDDFDEEVTKEEIDIIRKCVTQTAKEYIK